MLGLAMTPIVRGDVVQIPLAHNFNGMSHTGEQFDPDNPDGFRSISDRALVADGEQGSFGTDPIVGWTDLNYAIITDAGVLDLVHLGDRNTVAGGAWEWDSEPDGDNVGIQPDWLSDSDQHGEQRTDLESPLLLSGSAEIGLIYQASNGGSDVDFTLYFSDDSAVTVVVNAPDWFENRVPSAPNPGVLSQKQLSVYKGAEDTDNAAPGRDLNVAEAVVSLEELNLDGFGDYSGKELTAVSISNSSNFSAGFALFAVTVATEVSAPPNDDCADCTEVIEGRYDGTNHGASGEDVSSCGDNDWRDVWYCYRSSATGTATASLCGSDFNTTIAVYDQCDGTEIVCNDDFCGDQSEAGWEASAGSVYLIRVAGVDGAIGDFSLVIENGGPPVTVVNVALDYNFNGMVHVGEDSDPDNPDGFRSISDRAMNIDGGENSFGTDPIVGGTGLPYDIVLEAGVLDIVHLGNRNTVDGGTWRFDSEPDGDNIGIQPNWLPDVDQTGPQRTEFDPIVLDEDAEVGVLYNISNGGGDFDCTLEFTDGSSVVLRLNGPDWYQNQVPKSPGKGVRVQHQLGVYAGTGSTDQGFPDADLNIAEAVISILEIKEDGLGEFGGKRLNAISFSNRSRATAGYALYAATVRTSAPQGLRGDMNCDGSVDFNDIDPFVTALISQDDYEAQYPDCNYFNGDINEDGSVDFNDIDGFVECLINGGCP
jgi:hypothetical protein